jgi:hypothetical protein
MSRRPACSSRVRHEARNSASADGSKSGIRIDQTKVTVYMYSVSGLLTKSCQACRRVFANGCEREPQ